VDRITLSLAFAYPIINELLGHDAQFLTINIVAVTNTVLLRQKTRKVNNETVMQFHLLSKNKTWG
jgi:hypothetical protein